MVLRRRDHDGGGRARFGHRALRVTFLRRGDYVVDLYVVWEGRAHISFAGFDVADVDLGTVTVPERASYHVAEVRALLHSSPRRH